MRLRAFSRPIHLQARTYAKKPVEEGAEEGSKLSQIFTTVFEPAPRQKIPRTAEELADAEKIVKEYSRKCMHRERLWQQDLMEKIRLRNAATAALPERFLRAAKLFNRDFFPKERLIFTETPPVKRVAKKKAEKKSIFGKRR